MTRRHRAPRAAVSALLVAIAIGAAGTTGMVTVLAVDTPAAHVQIGGQLLDATGAPLAGIDLIVSEELPPDGGLAGFHATTGADGRFEVSVDPWGTREAPATFTFRTAAGTSISIIKTSCTQTWGVAVSDTRQLALADGAAPDPIALVGSTTLVGEVCGTTGTPRPTPVGNSQDHPRPGPTLPPTDAGATLDEQRERPASALLVGFAVGLAAAVILLVFPRTGARRRDD